MFPIRLIILTALFTIGIQAQENTVRFDIIKNEKIIGSLEIQIKKASSIIEYQLQSNIEVSFIKKFHIKARELYRFRNGKLVYSLVKRRINNKSNDPKELFFENTTYTLKSGEKTKNLSVKEIKANLAMLYLKEPNDIAKVYCDNQQVILGVKPVREHVYRIDFPNGTSNTFYYKDEKCVMIEVKAKFFKVELLPISS